MSARLLDRQELFASETWILRFTIVDSADTLMSLVGATAVWVLCDRGMKEALRKTTAGGGITSAGSVLSVSVSKTENDLLPENSDYYQELEVTIGGVAKKAAYGPVDIRRTAIRG